jgi:hypothetical protein
VSICPSPATLLRVADSEIEGSSEPPRSERRLANLHVTARFLGRNPATVKTYGDKGYCTIFKVRGYRGPFFDLNTIEEELAQQPATRVKKQNNFGPNARVVELVPGNTTLVQPVNVQPLADNIEPSVRIMPYELNGLTQADIDARRQEVLRRRAEAESSGAR